MLCRRPRTLAALLAAAGTALLATGCGGGRSAPVATVHSSATAPRSEALAFARCLRSHGLPNWPDPDSSGHFDKAKLRQLPISPSRVRAIEDGACNHLLPHSGGPQETAQQTRTRFAAALSFARCMRAHGLPRFPDPTSQGQLTVEMVTATGIDMHQPQVLRAGLACVPFSHGLLTRAAIERAVNGG